MSNKTLHQIGSVYSQQMGEQITMFTLFVYMLCMWVCVCVCETNEMKPGESPNRRCLFVFFSCYFRHTMYQMYCLFHYISSYYNVKIVKRLPNVHTAVMFIIPFCFCCCCCYFFHLFISFFTLVFGGVIVCVAVAAAISLSFHLDSDALFSIRLWAA